MDLSQIVNALIQNHTHRDFLVAVLQWEAFHGNNKRWKEITDLFFHHIHNKTSQQKIAAYYLHQISQNNRINVSYLQEQKNKVSQTLLHKSARVNDKSVRSHVAGVITKPSCVYIYKKRTFPRNIDPYLFAVSTLESICKCFEVEKKQLLECVYKGILQVSYQRTEVVFDYAEIFTLLLHRYENDKFIEITDDTILPLVAQGQLIAVYGNKKLYVRKSDLAVYRDIEGLDSIVLRDIKIAKTPSFIDTLPIRRIQRSLGLKESPIEEPPAPPKPKPSRIRYSKVKVKGKKAAAMPRDVGKEFARFKAKKKLDKEEREGRREEPLPEIIEEEKLRKVEEEKLSRKVEEKKVEEKKREEKEREEDIDDRTKGRMTEPTILLPSSEELSSSDEVLIVEEDRSETLLDIDDLDEPTTTTTVPTVDFSSSDFDDSSAAEEKTMTEELTFEEDSGSYVLESSDDVLIDSSGEILEIEGDPDMETFIESDTGLQKEPLEIDGDVTDKSDLKELADERQIAPFDEEPTLEQPTIQPSVTRAAGRAPAAGGLYAPEEFTRMEKKKGFSVFNAIFQIVAFVPRVIAYSVAFTFLAVKGIVVGMVNVVKNFATWLKRKCTKEVAGIEIPLFEVFLSEDAGQPGIMERTIAQSRLLISTLQATIGLRVVMLINLFDNLLEFVAGYINNIYRTWKISKSIHKRLSRRDKKRQIQGLYEDLNVVRHQISRLLCLPHFCPYTNNSLPQSNLQETFALELVLEIRYRLDEMKRDLSIFTVQQMTATAKKSVWDFITSFIPNPTELITPWKDFVIFAFFMRYSRRDLYTMYTEVLMSYKHIVLCLDDEEQFPTADYEQSMTKYINKMYEKRDIELHIEECRLQLQRIIQMLANAHKIVEVRCLQLEDLWFECRNNSKEHLGVRFHLEWEKRINRHVEKHIRAKNPWHRREKLLFYRRYRLQKKLAAKFI
ncbi:hypothetical protein [Candidatus Uabimicrobium amorphum]|uniref:Uncharacterized protein n=1 Tax=Uabimicrobium amorphum TaxID=2596890 RepID=A0A5S9F6A1_UABAM|nr:hypothetical protein [Candidatus Uabimicrobium amorphum]BBM86973.1 hypothetical protein UABAM_05375 [Candidatus Uabimicrobium amorphum]